MELTKHLQSAKVILINIVITAVQGFLAAWAVTGNKTDKASLGAAVAAAASAVWNLVVKPAMKANNILYK